MSASFPVKCHLPLITSRIEFMFNALQHPAKTLVPIYDDRIDAIQSPRTVLPFIFEVSLLQDPSPLYSATQILHHQRLTSILIVSSFDPQTTVPDREGGQGPLRSL